jgi:hypothetical protein
MAEPKCPSVIMTAVAGVARCWPNESLLASCARAEFPSSDAASNLDGDGVAKIDALPARLLPERPLAGVSRQR